MKRLQFSSSNPLRMVGLALTLALSPAVAAADTAYLVSESGVFASNAPISAESAPDATFSYSFLIDAAPVVNFVTNFTGPDCGFDSQFSNFSYTLNGAPVAVVGPDVEFFGTAFGGGASVSFADNDNFFLYTTAAAQFYTGTFENPTILPGSYMLDPTQSLYETDFIGTNATPISGNLSIAPTPEPSTLLLIATGLTGFGGIIRRKIRA